MEGNRKIRRIKLKVGDNPASALFGIVSAEPDYKLCLALNRKLGISLKSVTPLMIIDKEDSGTPFSRFSDTSDPAGMIYDLVSNHSGKICLVKKLKNIDFIFQVHNIDIDSETDRFMSMLRDTDCISGVFKITGEAVYGERNLQYLSR
jgi:hypothetical protein